jgi:hypothetical protein
MPSSMWSFTSSGLLVPLGLILGLKEGVSIPADWELWSTANDKFLKGTASDAVVGTTGVRSSLSLTVGGGGGHTGASIARVAGYGQGGSCSGSCAGPPSHSGSSVGSHGSHSIGFTYRPASAKLKLIQSVVRTKVPLGAIMLGTGGNPHQTAFSGLDGSKILEAAAATGITSQTAAANTTGSASDSHSHVYSANTTASGLMSGAYTSGGGTGGGSHVHAGGTPTITESLAKAVVRAFEIIDETKIEGLIGMWADIGVPTGWEVVADFDGRYLVFSPTGTGELSGSNTVSISGTTGASGHSHSFSGSSGYVFVSDIRHPNTESHVHGYSGSLSYEPERYHIKFIRYVG